MKFINSKVYENGITATLNDKFFIVLVAPGENGNGEAIATTACIDNTGSATPNYLSNKLIWEPETKSIKISEFSFDETKSLVTDGVKTAIEFALVKLDDSYKTTDPLEAYEGSGKPLIWPIIENDIPNDKKILSGNLSIDIDVGVGNNFKFKEAKITFSEGA